MANKTVMQKLSLHLIKEVHNKKSTPYTEGVQYAINAVFSLLQEEKIQIMESYDSGWNNGYRKEHDGGKTYYENTYQNTSNK